jgi:RNA polymerase sigma factor (sigma-70 family)
MHPAVAICRELAADRRTDGELLAAFVRDPSGEAAFGELVRRHGPLVWGACRRLLPNPSDAEDAFQAAFLVLMRRAGGLTRVPTIGPWLHRVAVWTARNVRRKNARRLARQAEFPDHVPDRPAPDPDLRADLDAALLALPARYRDPVVLCYLLGFTRREAADRLGCPEGTLSARLARSLEKLRARLRGLDPATVLTGAAVAVPAALSASAARAAVAGFAAGGVPPAVSILVEGVIRMFWVKKATAATVALFATFALGVGVGVSTRTEQSGAVAQDRVPGDAKPKPEAPAPPVDRAKQIAELEKLIATAEAARSSAAAGVKAVTERIELLKRVKAREKEWLADQETLFRFQIDLETATAQVQLLKAKLDSLKAAAAQPKKAPPAAGDPFAAQPPVTDIDRKLIELKRQLDAIQAERQKLDELKKSTDARAAELDRLIKEVLSAAADLQVKRADLANRPSTAAKGAYLEVTVTGKDVPGPCRVREFGADGKPVGSVVAEDLTILGPLFARAAKDPNGPKEVLVLVSRDAPAERLRAVLDACKLAGFNRVSVDDPSAPGIETEPKPKTPLPESPFNKPIGLDDELRKLKTEKPSLEDDLKKLKAEKASLEDELRRLRAERSLPKP